jgi:hypothetical protein
MITLFINRKIFLKCCVEQIKLYLSEKFNVDINVVICGKFKTIEFLDGRKLELKKKTIFKNEQNSKYYIHCHSDSNDSNKFLRILDEYEDIVHVSKMQYNMLEQKRDDFTSTTYIPQNLIYYTSLLQKTPFLEIKYRYDKGLYFAGRDVWFRADVLQNMQCVNVQPRTDFDLYFEKLSTIKLALSLPGIGNFCHREIECFGLGTPVLMPVLINQMRNPLIPDFHYVSVPRVKDIKEQAKLLDKRYLEVINDDQFLSFISKNCKEWYERNCKPPICYSIMFDEGFSKIL